MQQDSVAIARASYQAYVDKDRAAIEALIAPDFHFTSPLDNRIDRATYFARCWPNSATLAGFDWGARTACIIAALWPERCKALVSVSGYLIGSQESGKAPLPPKAELQWWYQYYFATERGRAGYDKNRHDFSKLIWQLASPKWDFGEATFDRTAASFDNPDYVDVVIHSYRHRYGLADGDPHYADIQRRLAALPAITVPTITLDGAADGVVPATDGTASAAKFTGRRTHRVIPHAGHNLPQEEPEAFAAAVMELIGA